MNGDIFGNTKTSIPDCLCVKVDRMSCQKRLRHDDMSETVCHKKRVTDCLIHQATTAPSRCCWVPMLPGSSASTAPVHDSAWVLCFNGTSSCWVPCFNGTSSCWVLCFNGTSSCTQLGAMLPGSSASTAPVRCFRTSHSSSRESAGWTSHYLSHSSMSLSSG